VFNALFTMHGITMIFFAAMPVLFGFANYLLSLMIGARDMTFPRLMPSVSGSRRLADSCYISALLAATGSTVLAMHPMSDGSLTRR